MRSVTNITLLSLTHHLQAQSILRLQHINVEDGLSQSSVNNIFQDAQVLSGLPPAMGSTGMMARVCGL